MPKPTNLSPEMLRLVHIAKREDRMEKVLSKTEKGKAILKRYKDHVSAIRKDWTQEEKAAFAEAKKILIEDPAYSSHPSNPA